MLFAYQLPIFSVIFPSCFMKPILTIILVLISATAFSQIESLQMLERKMASQLNIIKTGDEPNRIVASDSMSVLMVEAMNYRGCFEYPFDSLQMGKMTSPDNVFRIFNWNIPKDDQSHDYQCFILTQEEENIYDWTQCKQLTRADEKVHMKYLTPEKWFGCLYYEIIPMIKGKKGKMAKKKSYTLLGWDGNDKYSTKKIIDVITFNNGEIRFGSPLFKNKRGSPKRVILEYSDEVMVSLKYHPKQKRIVHDHLAPRDPIMTGVFAYYGPDMTFDAYNLEKGKWVFAEDIDIRLGKDAREFNDPGEE